MDNQTKMVLPRQLAFSIGRYHACADITALGACAHGPQVWPWWRLFSLSFFRLKSVEAPSTGYRVWLYTRAGGRAFDLYIDKRSEVAHG